MLLPRVPKEATSFGAIVGDLNNNLKFPQPRLSQGDEEEPPLILKPYVFFYFVKLLFYFRLDCRNCFLFELFIIFLSFSWISCKSQLINFLIQLLNINLTMAAY